MNIQEQIDKLQANIDNQQSQLDKLKSQAMKCEEPKIDWSKMIGRLVMVRDRDEQEWLGPVALDKLGEYGNFVVTGFISWNQCKLYDGPTCPNWVEWKGGECPVKNGVSILVEFRDGGIDVSRYALDYIWYRSGSDGDIIRYTILEP
jgi:hypothetical protein